MPVQVRAKYMTLEPTKNRYVAHMRAIRIIQVGLFGSCRIPITSSRWELFW